MAKYNPDINVEERQVKEDGYKTDQTENIVISHLKLSRWLGGLGALLPIILILASGIYSNEILPSISYYYYSLSRVLFVGIISAISVFLFTYNGFDMWERMICRIAGVSAFLIAICPTFINDNHSIIEGKNYTKADFSKFVIPATSNLNFVGYIHYAAAATFFALLAILILWKFVEHEKQSQAEHSEKAILAYRITGGLMFFSILMIALKGIVSSIFEDCDSWCIPYTFGFETVALWAFGVAWMVKGEIQRELHQTR